MIRVCTTQGGAHEPFSVPEARPATWYYKPQICLPCPAPHHCGADRALGIVERKQIHTGCLLLIPIRALPHRGTPAHTHPILGAPMLLSNSQEGLQRCLTAYEKHGISEDTAAPQKGQHPRPREEAGPWWAGRVAHPHYTPRHLRLKVTEDSKGAAAGPP